MRNHDFSIVKYLDKHKEQVLIVWEKSVLATHDFLKQDDFTSIKEFVKTIDFYDFEVYCLLRQEEVVGFLGVADKKIEMLFLLPAYVGMGLGKMLMDFAIGELKADRVDVNEKNLKAVNFYEKLGFKTYERTDKDG